ncbi:MAG: hypothetical protein NZ870_00715 [bacterium]|nr:hypothetical protein [bacterium]
MQDKTWIKLKELPITFKVLITLVISTYIFQHISSLLLVMHNIKINMGAAAVFENKTLLQMLRLTHQHLMGHGTMYFITSFIFLFTNVKPLLKIVLILAVFSGSWLDLAGWWLMKYYGESFEFLSKIAGSIMAGGFLIMSIFIIKETWQK